MHDGAVYKAFNLVEVGTTKGYARCNSKYTEASQPKRLLVYPLRPDARARLSAPEEQPEWRSPGQAVRYDADELRSRRELFEEADDFRTGPALKHALAAVLSLIVLAKLHGCMADGRSRASPRLCRKRTCKPWAAATTGAPRSIARPPTRPSRTPHYSSPHACNQV